MILRATFAALVLLSVSFFPDADKARAQAPSCALTAAQRTGFLNEHLFGGQPLEFMLDIADVAVGIVGNRAYRNPHQA